MIHSFFSFHDHLQCFIFSLVYFSSYISPDKFSSEKIFNPTSGGDIGVANGK